METYSCDDEQVREETGLDGSSSGFTDPPATNSVELWNWTENAKTWNLKRFRKKATWQLKFSKLEKIQEKATLAMLLCILKLALSALHTGLADKQFSPPVLHPLNKNNANRVSHQIMFLLFLHETSPHAKWLCNFALQACFLKHFGSTLIN